MKKREIIKKSQDFTKIIKHSKFLKNSSFVLYYSLREDNNIRFGIAVPTKYGNAVQRNKIKRQIRHIIDKNKMLFKNGQDYIIMVRKECINLSYQKLNNNLISLFKERTKNEETIK